MLQWGVNTCAAISTTTSLPLSFTTPLAAFCGLYQNDGGVRVGVSALTTTSITCKLINSDGKAIGSSAKHCWLALGK